MPITCTRKIEFDAAHRVIEHFSKCKHLHGHRYVVEATFIADELDSLGMVIDFGIIKKILGTWIDENWDHNTILSTQDKPLGDSIAAITNQKVYYINANPTAENMAKYLFEEICPNLFKDSHVKCIKIRLWETPNCHAEIN